jgi:hypothetical protein
LAEGYSVFLPSGAWVEDIPLPPPAARIVGQGRSRTTLTGTAGTLAWLEAAASTGLRTFEQLTLDADVTGRDGGDLTLEFFDCAVPGTLTLIGRLLMCRCSSAYTLVNCANVHVTDPIDVSAVNLGLTYVPSAGTNGTGALLSEIDGGTWANIDYDSEDVLVPLHVRSAWVSNSVRALTSASIKLTGSHAAGLIANDVGTSIEYDGPVGKTAPTLIGAGTFKTAEFLLARDVAENFGTGDIAMAIPKSAIVPDSTFISASIPGVEASFVSSTDSSVTVHVATTAPHVSYQLRVLVKT